MFQSMATRRWTLTKHNRGITLLAHTISFHDNCRMTTTDVQSLYERRPYPHYPLLATPRWQDGYLGSSLFARHLSEPKVIQEKPKRVLSIGCGEILPYILRKWEDPEVALTCVDLSARSLRRARFRCAWTQGSVTYIQADVNTWLSSAPSQAMLFDHIEAYGVIHHISHLDQTVALLAKHLTPDGTMRIMVYNAGPRDWIWQLNRIFRQLGLSYARDADLQTARTLLIQWSKHSPRLQQHLMSIGPKSLANNTRFADTFLHPWEARLNVERWLSLFQQNNLIPFALYDRYAELDDLPNPLWRMPTSKELSDRASDCRFENNLEVWFRHGGVSTKTIRDAPDLSKIPLRFKTKVPPSQWTKFPETKELPFKVRQDLWRGWLATLYQTDDAEVIRWIKTLPKLQAQRLARIGAILPEQAEAAGRYKELLSPMTKHVPTPEWPQGMDPALTDQLVEKNITGRKRSVITGRLAKL